jgi:uncharacterized protein with GYD domain
MPKYLVQANYVGEGLRGLLKEGGSSRRAVVEKLYQSVGGRVEAFYYAFGDTDLFVIGDVPDNVSAAALSLIVNAAGAATVKVTVLLTAEEIDAAAKKTATYRPPGQWWGIDLQPQPVKSPPTHVMRLAAVLAVVKYFNQTMAKPFKWTYKGKVLAA